MYKNVELPCCTPETNNILSQFYFKKRKKKMTYCAEKLNHR